MKNFIKNNFQKIVGSLILIVGLTACLDEIDLEVPAGEPVFTISGNIYTEPGPYSVFLSESAEFSSGPEGIPATILGATVVIKDDQGNEETLSEFDGGEYRTAIGGIQGIIGRSYHVEIQWNNKTYQSEPEEILPVSIPTGLSVARRDIQEINAAGNFVGETVIDLFVDTPFPTSVDGSFLKWSVFGQYEYSEIGTQGNLNPKTCYITEKIDFDNVVVASSEGVNGDVQLQKVITRNVDYRFTSKFCFSVVQQSITKSAYKFWSAVAEEFERSGNIFETPPAKIRGNIYNVDDIQEEVLGYFGAAAVDTIKILVDSDFVGNPAAQCRPFPAGPPSCTNCLSLNNSTLTKPDCWD